jgi:transglutaminase-like putative cysteine protease
MQGALMSGLFDCLFGPRRALAAAASRLMQVCLLGMLPCGLSHAQDIPANSANQKFNRIEAVIDVNGALHSRTQTYIEQEALNAPGALQIGKFTKAYNKDAQTYQVQEAYTLKADGRKIPVPADHILRQSGVAAPGAGLSWPNAEVIQLTFLDVQAGDRTVVRATEVESLPPLPGFFSYFDYLPAGETVDFVKIELTAPASVNVYVQGKPDKFTHTEHQGRTTWTLEARSIAQSMDEDAKDVYRVWPYFVASSFQSYEQFAMAYANQIRPKVQVTPEVQSLVNGLVKGQTDARTKARILFDWIRHNVRYVAIYLGNGGMVPHDVNTILANRYGDCKDQELLLQVMLKAIGIDAAPTLINAGSEYSFVQLPTLIFDHVIAYVPSLDLFLDPTASHIPFGRLPFGDQDKPVAVGLQPAGAVMRTPPDSAAQNSVDIHSVWHILANGDADAEVELHATGTSATVWQDWLERIPDGLQTDAATRVLRQSGYAGSASLSFPKVQRDLQEQSLRFKLHITNFLNDTEAGAIVLHPRLSNLAEYIGPNFGYSAASRVYSRTCEPITRSEHFELVFDPAFTITRLPKGEAIEGPDGISFTSSYRLDGHTILASRSLVLAQSRNICSPQDYQTRKPTFDRITKHLRKVALFQQ